MAIMWDRKRNFHLNAWTRFCYEGMIATYCGAMFSIVNSYEKLLTDRFFNKICHKTDR